MLLINCKVELKLKWINYCVLFANGNENDDVNSNNVIFTIKDTRLYVPTVTFSAKDNQKLSKLLRKEFENETKIENENATNEYRYFLKLSFVGVNRLFVLFLFILR